MASRKRKHSSDDKERLGLSEVGRVNGTTASTSAAADDDDSDSGSSYDSAADEVLLRKLSQSCLTASQQTPETRQTQREAGIIEQVEVTNFMSHSKLSFQCVLQTFRLSSLLLACVT